MMMNKSIPELATIRISCSEDGTALLFFPSSDLEYAYIFTAKHCLSGKNFDKTFTYKDVKFEKLFNPETGTYHECELTETDVITVSEDAEDLALIILPKQRILGLTGVEFECEVIDTDKEIIDYTVRGFATINKQEADRSFPLKFLEDQKDNGNLFLLKSDENLNTFYHSANDNVEGLSGSGVFALSNGILYLVGIMHRYEDGDVFTATKVLLFNQLIDSSRFKLINVVKPETNGSVLHTFRRMESNREEINRRTNDTIGTLTISRETTPIQQLLDSFGMAVIHGKPGVGKSALAKSLVNALKDQPGTTVITFTAEQLYCDYLKDAFTKANYTADIADLLASPLSGNRFIIWVESFEKLIESGFDGAVKELLLLIKTKRNVQMLVTIRDYTLQKFKINYRYELPKGEIYYQLKDFDDEEMQQVEMAIPSITPLLENPKIQYLLRTPYYLDKAVRILPELLNVGQLDEIEFKRLMWELIVEAGQQQRGETFSAICIKRARELSLFTRSDEPPEIIAELVRDNMLQKERSELNNRYSPSHDILEDWALIRDIKKRQQDAEDPIAFITSLENRPALTRAFRLWIDEFYKNEPQASASFVHTILTNLEIEQSWKDILIIATLRSDYAEILFEALSPRLLSNKGHFLKEVIHLLETGCKTIDYRDNEFDKFLPIGSGWDYMIRFIRKNHQLILSFGLSEFVYLSLIESWSKQLPDFNPGKLPLAATDAAFLLTEFICSNQNNFNDLLFKKYIVMLFQLTGAAVGTIEELLEAAVHFAEDNPKWQNKGLIKSVRQYAIGGVISDQLCKYFPEKVIKIASDEWGKKEQIKRPGSIMSMISKEPDLDDFDLDDSIKNDYGFPSGYQTFYYWMFLYHSNLALDFLVPFLNSAFEKNYKVRLKRREGDEQNIKVSIDFEDSSVREYFGCYEYWVMYRGTNSRDRLITSLLMALEKAMLDLADLGKDNYPTIKNYMSRLIKETNNVAVLAVVSSVMQAHPDLLDETSVRLLGIPIFFKWDSSRYSSEMMHLDNYNDDPFQKQERIGEDKRLHRQKFYLGLVEFVAHYMFFHQTLNKQLFLQVDKMWETAPENDTLWRKFLFDMDARKYSLIPIEKTGYENLGHLTPGYDDDVQQMRNKNTSERVPDIGMVWAQKVFEGEEVPNKTYEAWKKGYNYIRTKQGEQLFTSPGAMAAIGLRDFCENLLQEEIDWCHKELISYGKRKLKPIDPWDMSSFAMDENQALTGISLIFKSNPSENISREAKELIFRLLVSRIDERSKIHLEHGMTQYLPNTQPDYLNNCWIGILKYIDKLSEKKKPMVFGISYEHDNEDDPENADDWQEDLIKSVIDCTIERPDAIDITLQWNTHRLVNDALRIIPYESDIILQHDFIHLLLIRHIQFLNDTSERYRSDFYEARHAFTFYYPRFILAQEQNSSVKYFEELLDLTSKEKRANQRDELVTFLHGLIKEFILAVNTGSNVANFWVFWDILKQWMISQNDGYLFSIFLMGIEWNESSDNWFVLDGKNLYFKDFVLKYGFNQINETVKFLAGISFRKFMPDSISWIASMLLSTTANQLDVRLAEKFIGKAFYNYGITIKANKALLVDFIFMLEFMIKKGSTKAYMLKEELIQYKLTN